MGTCGLRFIHCLISNKATNTKVMLALVSGSAVQRWTSLWTPTEYSIWLPCCLSGVPNWWKLPQSFSHTFKLRHNCLHYSDYCVHILPLLHTGFLEQCIRQVHLSQSKQVVCYVVTGQNTYQQMLCSDKHTCYMYVGSFLRQQIYNVSVYTVLV